MLHIHNPHSGLLLPARTSYFMLRLLIFLAFLVNFASPAEAPPTFQISPILDVNKLKYIEQDSIYCASEYEQGDFKSNECKNDLSKGIINACISITIPSNETDRGRILYGCAPLSHLPTNCSRKDNPLKPQSYYYPWANITYKGSRNLGALACCGTDNCNESEEPVIAAVRIMTEETWADKAMDSFPWIFFTVVFTVCFSPQFNEHVAKKSANGLKRGETAEMLPVHGKDGVEMKQQDQSGKPKATFETIRQLNHVLREIKKNDKPEEDTFVEEREVHHAKLHETVYNYRYEEHRVTEVERNHLTNKSSLAERMIEHGPYKYNFNLIELAEMFDTVAQSFENDATLMNLPNDIFVIGNLEGSYGDLFSWFNLIGWPPRRKVLFLGGLTSNDEYYSLETISLIFALKQRCPESVFVLRGAAECSNVELKHRFPRRIAAALSDIILRACRNLPLAATIDNKIFCSHGGVPIKLEKLSLIGKIRRPIYEVKDRSIVADLILSVISNENALVSGSRAHMFDPSSKEFFHLACRLRMEYFIRSRNPSMNGHQKIGDHLLSIWSSPGKKGTAAATVVYISNNNLMTLLRLRVDTTLVVENPMANSVNKIETTFSVIQESTNHSEITETIEASELIGRIEGSIERFNISGNLPERLKQLLRRISTLRLFPCVPTTNVQSQFKYLQ